MGVIGIELNRLFYFAFVQLFWREIEKGTEEMEFRAKRNRSFNTN